MDATVISEIHEKQRQAVLDEYNALVSDAQCLAKELDRLAPDGLSGYHMSWSEVVDLVKHHQLMLAKVIKLMQSRVAEGVA